MRLISHATAASVLAVLAACTPVNEPTRDIADAGQRTTPAVSGPLHVGMSSSDVVVALGAPNAVTRDGRRRETWVYAGMGIGTVVAASGRGRTVPHPAAEGGHAGAAPRTPATLRVVVMFDEAGTVRDFAYHSGGT